MRPVTEEIPAANGTEKIRALFVCTHNSARSRMAEGYLRSAYGHRFEAGSAGTEIRPVHPMAVTVMQEIGIDLSGSCSKRLDEFFDWKPAVVVTVCDRAQQTCPFFPGGKTRIHAGFSDPSACTGTQDECLAVFREVRDAIITWIDAVFVPYYGTGRQNFDELTGTAGNTEEGIAPHKPFVPEIHRAANGDIYQSVRSCDLERISDK
jgi:arsenate reductase